MSTLFRTTALFTILFASSLHCQIIGGLDDLRLGAASASNAGGGGGNGGGPVGSGGSSPSSSSSSSNGSSSGSGGGNPAPSVVLWSKRFGDGTQQYVTDSAVDADGNIFVVGYFAGTLDFGNGMPLVTAGDLDGFIAKFDTDGNSLWSSRLGGIGPDRAESVALTSAGDPIVAGSFGGSLSFGGKSWTFAGGTDGFVFKLSSVNGDLVWGDRFGDPQNQRAISVAVAPTTQDVVCLGDFEGSIMFGGSTLTSVGLEDILLARYSSDGAGQSGLRLGDGQSQLARGLAIDTSGVAFIAGLFDGTINWGITPLTSAGGGDVFLAKTLANGQASWAKRMGDATIQRPNALAPSSDGGVIAVGAFEGMVDIGGTTAFSKGGYDAFILKLASAGDVQWIRTLDDDDAMGLDQEAMDAVVAEDGNVFVTGRIDGNVDLGDGVITGPNDVDLFVMRIGSDGKTIWSKRFGELAPQNGRAVALSGPEHIVVAGDFRGTMDLGNGPLTSAGSQDVFIAKMVR